MKGHEFQFLIGNQVWSNNTLKKLSLLEQEGNIPGGLAGLWPLQ